MWADQVRALSAFGTVIEARIASPAIANLILFYVLSPSRRSTTLLLQWQRASCPSTEPGLPETRTVRKGRQGGLWTSFDNVVSNSTWNDLLAKMRLELHPSTRQGFRDFVSN
jgi:hypothetical protein